MNRHDIEKWLARGWLVPDEEDGWYRFTREFVGYDGDGVAVFRETRDRNRIRVVEEGMLPVR